MPYVRRVNKIKENAAPDISNYYDRCRRGKYDNVSIPVNGGSIQIFKPAFLRHGTIIQASVSSSDAQLTEFLGNATAAYRERWGGRESSLKDLSSNRTLARDSLALYFETEINAAEFAGDKNDTPVTVPLTVQIYPGRLVKNEDDFIIRQGVLENVYRFKRNGKEIEEYRPVFVREIVFNSEKMEKLNSKYLVKKGIDENLHNKNLVIAEAAKRELGFDYKERKGECLSQVCISPEEVFHHDLPKKLLKETKKSSFKEMIINLHNQDKYDITVSRMDIQVKPDNRVSMEAENTEKLFSDFFSYLNPKIPAGSAISYLEYEEPGAMKHVRTAGRVAKKAAKIGVPIAVGAYLLYEGEKAAAPYVLPHTDKIAAGAVGMAALYLGYKGVKFAAGKIGNIKTDFSLSDKLSDFSEYVSDKTKDSVIAHPIRVPKKRRAKEDAMIINHLNSLGIRTNETRRGSCMVQIDRKTCLEIAKNKAEKTEA